MIVVDIVDSVHEDTVIYRHINRKGERHCADGAAELWSDGSRFFYKQGMLHRTDGPALIESYFDTSRNMRIWFCEWHIDGKEVTHDVWDWIKRHNIEFSECGEFLTDDDKLFFQLSFV